MQRNINFVKSLKGKVIHLTDKNGTALCDSRIKINLELCEHYLSIVLVDCPKCKKTKKYQELSQKSVEEKDKKEIQKEEKKEPKQKAEPVKVFEDHYITYSELQSLLQNKLKFHKKGILTQVEDIVKNTVNEVLSSKPDFIIVSKTNNKFSIIHEPSRHVITGDLSLESAQKLLELYLNIPIKWNGIDSPPNDWLSYIREIFENFMGKTKEENIKLTVKRERKSKKQSLGIRRRSTGLKIRRKK